MTGQKAPQMIYRHLGRTGLKVSLCILIRMPRQMDHACDYVMNAFPEVQLCQRQYCITVVSSHPTSYWQPHRPNHCGVFLLIIRLLAGICSQLWRMGDIWEPDWSPRSHKMPLHSHTPILHYLGRRS